MRFDWKKYLTLAQEWTELSKKHTDKEALLRCTISRAYYAAFCKTRNHLRDIDKDKSLDKSSNVHQFVIDRFHRSDDKTRREIGSRLICLRKIRNIADYQDRFRNLEVTALQSLNYAQEVIENLEKLRF